MNFENKTVVVVGAAKSGQSSARLLHRLGAHVKISEAGKPDTSDKEFCLWAQQNNMAMEFNGHTKDFILESDAVVLSPGVRSDALPVLWAREKNIPVLGEIELGALVCTKPIIAVTGSNGKTTVSTLISLLINANGKRACLCGNVGTPFTEFVLESDRYDYFVTEISSFQLETIQTFKPHIAVLLNFTQNHLDRHKDMDEYFNAKRRIFENQDHNDFAVLNAQDIWCKKAASGLESRICFFNQGEFSSQGIINPNHLAVLCVAKILGLSLEVCLQELKNFKGVEHRMEKVRVLDGVEYINDSKATTVEAGRWALESTSQPIVMLCGGRDKNLDFAPLRALVAQKVKKMIIFGEARAKLRTAFDGAVSLEECETLEQAIAAGRQAAIAGDVVMLVPMCTSYDSFKNFEERGAAFKQIVRNLK